MGLSLSTRRALALGATYTDKVLGTDPIAYWPLSEGGGTTAQCKINALQNGTYSSDVATMGIGPGIGDGNTAAYFDGAGGDFVNVGSATFNAAFNGAEGTFMQWARVANVGAWTDGSERRSWVCLVDGNNFVIVGKSNANNQFRGLYKAGGGATESVTQAGLTTTAWVCWIFTWSKTFDRVQLFYNGVSTGTDTSSGVWAGNPATHNIGGQGALTPWHGWLAHNAVWDRVLGTNEIVLLSSV